MVPLEKSAARDIGKLSNKLRRRLDALSSRGAFSGAQGRVLHFILAQNDDVFQRDIEEEYGLRPSTASELLRQMENNGLIRREITPYDGRFKRIIATEKAQGLRAQVMADLTALETELTAGVTPEQLDVFFQVTEILLKNLSDERSAPRRRRKEGSAL